VPPIRHAPPTLPASHAGCSVSIPLASPTSAVSGASPPGVVGSHPNPVIGHSFGGLLAQILARRGLAAVSVAIDLHALTIDTGWREVADTALAFTQRFSNLQPAASRTAGS
jgi:hypothetical protein